MKTRNAFISLLIMSILFLTSMARSQSQSGSNLQVKINVQTDQAVYGNNEPVIAKVTLQNMSSQDFTVPYDSFRDVERHLSFTVQNTAGQLMPLTRFGQLLHQQSTNKFHSYRTMRIKHGEAFVLKFAINRIIDLTVPDTYKLRVTDNLPTNSLNLKQLNSNSVNFQVAGSATYNP